MRGQLPPKDQVWTVIALGLLLALLLIVIGVYLDRAAGSPVQSPPLEDIF